MPPFIAKLLKKFGVDPKLVETYKAITGASWSEILIKLLQFGPSIAGIIQQIIDALKKPTPTPAQAAQTPAHCCSATLYCCDDVIDAAQETLYRALLCKAAHMHPDLYDDNDINDQDCDDSEDC